MMNVTEEGKLDSVRFGGFISVTEDKNMKPAKSWKTTMAGIGMILGALTLGINIVTGNAAPSMENITIILTGIGGGIGLITAKDATVTGTGDNATNG